MLLLKRFENGDNKFKIFKPIIKPKNKRFEGGG